MRQIELQRSWGIDRVFLGLIGVLLLINMPMFIGLVRPLHDTNYVFQSFYFTYNEFFFNNELPGWQPFGRYGVQSYLPMVISLSPANMFAGLIGWVLKVENVLLLFKASLFLEQLIFLFGTYILSRRIFKHKATVAFVCLTAMCSSVLTYQIWFDFRVYYLLPLIVHFLLRFFSEMKLRHLALAMVLFDVSLLGLATYLSVLLSLEILVVGLVLLLGNFNRLPDLLNTSKRDVMQGTVMFAIFAAATLAYYHFSVNSLELIESLVPGRDPLTKQVDLETFLTYGSYVGFGKFVELVLPSGAFTALDATIYVGLITLVFLFYRFIKADILISIGLVLAFAVSVLVFMNYEIVASLYALFPAIKYLLPLLTLIFLIYVYTRTGNLVLTAFASVVAVLGLFSLGDKTFVAEFLYRHFPMMEYYRHIGLAVGSFKLFLPLLAGFGLDSFLSRPDLQKDAGEDGVRTLLGAETGISVLIVLDGLIFAFTFHLYGFIAASGMPSGSFGSIAALYLFMVAVFLLSLFALRKQISLRKHFLVFLIACVCFEMFGYQALVNYKFHLETKTMSLKKEPGFVNRYGFQEERAMEPTNERARLILDSVLPRSNYVVFRVNYATAYNFAQWDPCVPYLKVLYVNSNVARLFRLKGGYVSHWKFALPDDKQFVSAIGCESPKLKLAFDVVFTDTVEETEYHIRNAQDIDEVPVLYGVPKDVRASWMRAGPQSNINGTIKVTGFSANRLDLEVDVPGSRGAWLYYADAWHPGWKAFVNDRPVRIAQANLAFKAIMLDGGSSKVRFVFDDAFMRICSYLFSAMGIVFSAMVAAGIVLTVFKREKGT